MTKAALAWGWSCIRISLESNRAQGHRIMDEAHKTCSYSKTLHGDTSVKLVVD